MGFHQPIFMYIFNLHIKSRNGNTEKLKEIIKYCVKVFSIEGYEKVGVSI